MQLSVGVEYAFHSLFYMIDLPTGTTVGIRQLAGLHDITESYLSKIFSKLRKAGIVRSVSGVKGGYELARPADEVTFWDVVEAVEGASFFFQCAEIRQKNIFEDGSSVFSSKCPCLIKVVMQEAEEAFRDKLRARSLGWLHAQVQGGFSEGKRQAMAAWMRSL
ncbi:Rrf2 family transcriptional regulator [Solidesulfovibrio sp.]|uniref:RrF2 family transcriptional regulator n=1 Tax=Solidesulfovibrio sp. TaxID=2910990 RepID=UPI002B204EBC|nr:Rrf2 family transcriptional regulator [Solidesulfovibrio sp.]MEA5090312.1 Rrf2 family transcriptional regulator [Solidesulfovibrio sp.]